MFRGKRALASSSVRRQRPEPFRHGMPHSVGYSVFPALPTSAIRTAAARYCRRLLSSADLARPRVDDGCPAADRGDWPSRPGSSPRAPGKDLVGPPSVPLDVVTSISGEPTRRLVRATHVQRSSREESTARGAQRLSSWARSVQARRPAGAAPANARMTSAHALAPGQDPISATARGISAPRRTRWTGSPSGTTGATALVVRSSRCMRHAQAGRTRTVARDQYRTAAGTSGRSVTRQTALARRRPSPGRCLRVVPER